MDALLTVAGVVVGVLAAAFLVLTVVGIALLVRRARRTAVRSVPQRAAAGGELLRADEALRDAEDELAFAIAQFGEAGTAGFRKAVEQGRGELRRAFELQQRIADSPAADARRRREWARDVQAIAVRVRTGLEAEGRRFAERRDEEANAAPAIAGLRARLAGLREALDESGAALEALGRDYAAELVAPVAGNPESAAALLEEAAARLDAAEAQLAERRVTDVGDGLREAREQLGRADALLAAIGRRGEELAAAGDALGELRARAQAALAEARALRDAPPDADFGEKVGEAIATLDGVLAAAAPESRGAPRDPVAELDALVAAADRLDVAVAAARNQQRRLDGARDALGGALVSARTQIAAVRDYIGARRGQVGVEARTRLSEAERQLLLAEHEADPVAALDAARRAQTHARDADALARYRGA